MDRGAGQHVVEGGEVRLHGQLEDVQRPATVHAYRLRAQHGVKPGPEPFEVLELRASSGSSTSSTQASPIVR